jgi:glycosyltransferase involved in cell wall biosynthesis
VLDDEVALLVAPEPAAFADAMVRLLDDAPLRERLSRNAAERARTKYSREIYVSRTDTACERLVAVRA